MARDRCGFSWDVVLPLSKTSIAALFVIQFIYGWNQYLWPLLITTQESMYTTVIGIKRMIAGGEALEAQEPLIAAGRGGSVGDDFDGDDARHPGLLVDGSAARSYHRSPFKERST